MWPTSRSTLAIQIYVHLRRRAVGASEIVAVMRQFPEAFHAVLRPTEAQLIRLVHDGIWALTTLVSMRLPLEGDDRRCRPLISGSLTPTEPNDPDDPAVKLRHQLREKLGVDRVNGEVVYLFDRLVEVAEHLNALEEYCLTRRILEPGCRAQIQSPICRHPARSSPG